YVRGNAGRRRVASAALQQVRAVQRRGVDFDQDLFIASGGWPCNIADLEYLGTAKAANKCGFHRVSDAASGRPRLLAQFIIEYSAILQKHSERSPILS